MWPPADVHRDSTISTICLWPLNAMLIFSFKLISKELLLEQLEIRNISVCRCFHTLSRVASNLLSDVWVDSLALCWRFLFCAFSTAWLSALEVTAEALRPNTAVPAAPTATLYPRQVTAQDKWQLCCQSVSQKASSTWEENCYAKRTHFNFPELRRWWSVNFYLVLWNCVAKTTSKCLKMGNTVKL